VFYQLPPARRDYAGICISLARLKTVSAEEAAEFGEELRRLTGLRIVSAYRPRA
jgi:hypothetical protein